jgi:hypothetical protein
MQVELLVLSDDGVSEGFWKLLLSKTSVGISKIILTGQVGVVSVRLRNRQVDIALLSGHPSSLAVKQRAFRLMIGFLFQDNRFITQQWWGASVGRLQR